MDLTNKSAHTTSAIAPRRPTRMASALTRKSMNPLGTLFGKTSIRLAASENLSPTDIREFLHSECSDLKVRINKNKAKVFRRRYGDWARAVLILKKRKNDEIRGYFRFMRSTQLFFGFGTLFATTWILATLAMVTLSEAGQDYWFFPIVGIAIFTFHMLILKFGCKQHIRDIDTLSQLLGKKFEVITKVNQSAHTTPAIAPR